MCSNLYIQTSIMAVEFDGGVIIGADSRTSSGYGAVTCTCQSIVLYIAYRTFLWGGGGEGGLPRQYHVYKIYTNPKLYTLHHPYCKLH